MILIKKSREPKSLTEYKRQKHISYDGYPHKDELRELLLKDQGYLCAYCMRRIENDSSKMKIEHWVPQSKLKTELKKLDFKIMLGVCDGCRGAADKYTTCDEHRHNAELTVNPMRKDMIDTIYYDREGFIYSTDPNINEDLKTTLNLNCEKAASKLVVNRKKVYEQCMQRLIRMQRQGMWKENMLKRVLEYYTAKQDGKYCEYAGVAIYLLNKYLNKCRK